MANEARTFRTADISDLRWQVLARFSEDGAAVDFEEKFVHDIHVRIHTGFLRVIAWMPTNENRLFEYDFKNFIYV